MLRFLARHSVWTGSEADQISSRKSPSTSGKHTKPIRADCMRRTSTSMLPSQWPRYARWQCWWWNGSFRTVTRARSWCCPRSSRSRRSSCSRRGCATIRVTRRCATTRRRTRRTWTWTWRTTTHCVLSTWPDVRRSTRPSRIWSIRRRPTRTVTIRASRTRWSGRRVFVVMLVGRTVRGTGVRRSFRIPTDDWRSPSRTFWIRISSLVDSRFIVMGFVVGSRSMGPGARQITKEAKQVSSNQNSKLNF